MNEFFPKVIKKRTGKVTEFNLAKIMSAIYRAEYAIGGRDKESAARLADEVARKIFTDFTAHSRIPTVDDCNAACVEGLRVNGSEKTADKFESYALDRTLVRQREHPLLAKIVLVTRSHGYVAKPVAAFIEMAKTFDCREPRMISPHALAASRKRPTSPAAPRPIA